MWDHLFGDVVAHGSDCVTPGMDPSSLAGNDVEGVQIGVEEEETNNEEGVGDQVYTEYTQYSSRLETLERSEGTFQCDFTDEVRNGNRQEPTQGHGATQGPSSGIGTSKEPQK